MIIPMCCFSCGRPISHQYLEYLDLVKQYEIDDQSADVKPEKNAEFRALAKLQIWRECCRRMMLCQHDLYTQVR